MDPQATHRPTRHHVVFKCGRIDMAADSFHVIRTAPVQMRLIFLLPLRDLAYPADTGFALLLIVSQPLRTH